MADSSDIASIYEQVLGRSPDQSGMVSYTATLDSGADLSTIESLVAHSPEAQANLEQIYWQVLGREADPSGLATYLGEMSNGVSLAQVRAIIAASPEAQNRLEQIYNEVLGREADPGGLATYRDALANGSSLAQVRAIIASSGELEGYLEQAYRNVLGRDADSGGLATYQSALANGWTLSGVRSNMATSAEAQADVTSLFQQLLNRGPSPVELASAEAQLAEGASLDDLQQQLSSGGSLVIGPAMLLQADTSVTGAATLPKTDALLSQPAAIPGTDFVSIGPATPAQTNSVAIDLANLGASDGAILFPGSGGSLTTSAGTWTFSTATGGGGYIVLLNGQQAAGGSAVELEVANHGNVYAKNSTGIWYEWSGSSWGQVTPPASIELTPSYLGVIGNGAATSMMIPVPNDFNYSASQLSVTVKALPSNGTILLSDGVTPVSVGQKLSVAQLTGLEFRPTANVFNQSSGLTYTVTDPAGSTADGNAWISVGGNPSALWHDPPSGANASPGIDFAPMTVQPSQAGDLVGVRLQNTGTITEAAGYVSFGMVFLDAAVNPGSSLIARINGVNYAVQMDVKSTNADGSVRQAILTLDAPAIPAGGTLDMMLSKGTASGASSAAPSASALLASGYSVGANFTFHNPDGTTTTDSASASVALQAALNAGTVKTWLSGPGVNEYDVVTTVDGGKLKVEFDIRAYANGTTTTDVIFDNSWMFSPGKTDLNYDVSISQGGQQIYSASNVKQYLYSLWDHQVASAGTINPNIQYDEAYLAATGAIQTYDTSYGVSNAAIQGNYAALNAINTGPMGTGIVTTYMPSTGGRQDIAPQPNWTAQWLLSQDPSAYQVMMANASASGSVPWHYTDESTGQAVNGETYPSLFWGTNPVNGLPEFSNGSGLSADGDPWQPDNAHLPELNYLPYLVSGSHYQLELLQAAADYAIYSVDGYGLTYDTSNTVPMGFAASFVNVPGNPAGNNTSNGNQSRAIAWELRTVADAAYLTPDNDPLKSYFVNELNKGMTGLVQEYITDNVNAPWGQLNGFVEGSSGPMGGNAPNTGPLAMDYFVTSLAEVAGMNIPGASDQAIQMLQYMNNFVSGLFTNGPNGFNPLDGTFYWAYIDDPTALTPYTTWSQFFNGNSNASWQQGYPGLAVNPTSIINFNTQTMGGYAELARAALADEITYTQSPQAIEAYGLVVSQISYAFSLGGNTINDGSGPTEAAAYQNFPQWSIMPRLSDGIWLKASQMQIDTSNAATVSLTGAAGQDVLLGVVGGGKATLTSKSASNGSALLYGGSGPTTLIAGAGNDYMFGGGSGSSYMYQPVNGNYEANGSTTLAFGPQQTTTFIAGTGNDYMHGGPGPNVYNFNLNAVAPRTSTIANFNISTDQLHIAANLDGNGITSASQLLAGATLSNGNTMLHLSPNDSITLLGVSTPSTLVNSILIS